MMNDDDPIDALETAAGDFARNQITLEQFVEARRAVTLESKKLLDRKRRMESAIINAQQFGRLEDGASRVYGRCPFCKLYTKDGANNKSHEKHCIVKLIETWRDE